MSNRETSEAENFPPSEHPPFSPIEGGWLQKQVIDAIRDSPSANKVSDLL